jgi:hypothetical protein
VYAAPNGLISYTQAHSVSMPPGSILCPFTYQKQDGDAFGTLSTNVFGARGLMACPTDDYQWQVFAAMPNATVPSGDVDDCVGFGALTYDYEEDGAAAFQYT